jgi:hypothetical protein
MEKSKGLGDEIAKLTRVTGIHAVVKTATKVVSKVVGKDLDCGCSYRQELLNQAFPFNKE